MNEEHDLQQEGNDIFPNNGALKVGAEAQAGADQTDSVLIPREAAQYLRISVATLLRHSRTGEIPGHPVGKLWRYRKSELDEWLRRKVSFFRHPCRK